MSIKARPNPVPLHPSTAPQRLRSGGAPVKPFTPAELARLALDEKKGFDLVTIPLAGKSTMADHLVIATGTSARHVATLAEAVVDMLGRSHTPVISTEGLSDCFWVIVDAGDVIVHIFQEDARRLYQLEKMWSLSFDTAEDDDAA